MTLAEKLDGIRAAGAKRIPAEKRAIMGAAQLALGISAAHLAICRDILTILR